MKTRTGWLKRLFGAAEWRERSKTRRRGDVPREKKAKRKTASASRRRNRS